MRTLGSLLVIVLLSAAAEAAWAEDWRPERPDWMAVDCGPTLTRNDRRLASTRRSPCCCRRDQTCGWTFAAGALAMARIDSSDSPVLLDSANNDAEVLSGDDYDLGFAPGFELAITKHRLFGCVDLELKGTWIGEWEDDKDFAFLDDPRIASDPTWVVPSVGPVATEYESQLGSLELNARWRMPCLDRVRWLAGFRIISLEEEMNIAFNDPDTSWYYDVETQNLLYGLQIGADIDLINARRFCLGVTLKGGGYFNQASHDASLRQSGLAFWEVDEDDDGFTYVLEAALGATWCLNDCFALRAEYRVMWIDGLALAPEQTAATRPVAQSMTANGIDTDGGILLHGLYLGAEFRF